MDEQKFIARTGGQSGPEESGATGGGTQARADYVGYLIGDVSRMIRTVYDRRVEPLGLTRAAGKLYPDRTGGRA